MARRTADLDRVPTGIGGFDRIVGGGLFTGGVYILQGPPGAGKTIFGNQFCFHHVENGSRAVYVTLLAESHTRMIAHVRRLSFFHAPAIPERLHYLSAFKVLEQDGLAGLLKTVRDAVVSRQATLLVMDGLVSAEEMSPSEQQYKKFIYEIQTITGMTQCLALLLMNTQRKRPGSYPEHTMVDGIIELRADHEALTLRRRIEVLKFRGSDFTSGQHTVEITGEGLIVRPRIETYIQLGRPREVREETLTSPVPFGLSGLDEALRGGLPRNSVTMVLGATGSGKTILGLRFLTEGARRGERGMYFGFYEKPEAIFRKSDRLGLGIRQAVESGLLDVVWQQPTEGIIDILGERLLRVMREHGATRVVLDGLDGFQTAAEFEGRTREVFAALVEEFESHGATTLYTAETRDVLGPQIELPFSGVSASTHNILLLRHVELGAQLYRLISIIKIRDSGYDSRIREFVIDDAGISVADTFESADAILSGIAHRAPAGSTSAPKVRQSGPPAGSRRRRS